MINLSTLAEYIRLEKKYYCWISAKIEGHIFTVEDYGFDGVTKTFYLFCDSSFNHSINGNKILRLDKQYSTIKLSLVCSEISRIIDVNSFSLSMVKIMKKTV